MSPPADVPDAPGAAHGYGDVPEPDEYDELDELDADERPGPRAPGRSRLRIPPGTDRRRLAWAVAGGVVGLVAAVLLGVLTLRNEGQRITATTVGYSVQSDTSVVVSFDVSRPPGTPVTCTIRDIDGHFTAVGSASVVIPVTPDRVVHQESTVRTTTRAVTGVVQDCVRGTAGG